MVDQLPANIRRHGTGFRAVVSRGGERRRSPTFATIKQAEEWRDRFVAAAGGDGALLTFDAAHKQLVVELQLVAARADTLKFYERVHANLLQHFRGDTIIATLTAKDVQQFIAARLARVSPQTVTHKDLPLLRRYVRFAIRLGQVQRDPFLDVRAPRARKGRFDALSGAEVADILRRMREHGSTEGQKARANRDADIVELLFLTGLRRSELARLRVHDIDEDNMRLFVDGKTGNSYVPIAAPVLAILQRMKLRAKKDGRLVTSVHAIEDTLDLWRERLNLRKLSAHVLRHSFGTALARANESPYVLRDLLRHATLQQSARYLHAQGDQGIGAVERLAQRLRPPAPHRTDAPAPRPNAPVSSDRTPPRSPEADRPADG